MSTADLNRIEDLDATGKRVFVRVDFNVPLTDDGRVADDSRLRAHLPTIKTLLGKKCGVILASHLGRPKGKADPKFSLKPVVEPLSQLLGIDVRFAPECVGEQTQKAVESLGEGAVLLLENLRFHPEEEANDEAFGRALVAPADAYVNDAFASAHRAHASVDAAAKAARQAAAGPLLCAEVEFLQRALTVPQRPLVAVIGGAKISTKIAVLNALVEKVDSLLVGGAMANTFLGALGLEVGQSLVEADQYETAVEVLDNALSRGVEVLLPVDVRCSTKDALGGEYVHTVGARYMTKDLSALDIGPQTEARFAEALSRAGTILWNGPMGLFESDTYSRGTLAVARAVAACRGLTVAGGGDTLAALNRLGLADAVDHLSTGGGAFLEYIEGKDLPGIAALKRARKKAA